MTRETLSQFNARCAEEARVLHDRLAEIGHPVTPEEAKFLWLVGKVALAESLGLDASCLDEKLRELAGQLPRVGDERAARERAEAARQAAAKEEL